MSGDEFAFLALGLILGIAVGAAMVEVLRARPPRRAEVRVTIARDQIPARSSTLAATTPPTATEPAAFGPGETAGAGREPARAGRTAAGVSGGIGVEGGGGWVDAGGGSPVDPYPLGTDVHLRRFGPRSAQPVAELDPDRAPARPPVAIPIEPTPDPLLVALQRATPVADGGATRSSATELGVRRDPVSTGAKGEDAAVVAATSVATSVEVAAPVRLLGALLRREPEAIARIALIAAGTAADAETMSGYGRLLRDLVDVVEERAAEAGWVDVGSGPGFWRELGASDASAVARALAALGFRCDGAGGFLDDIVPSQRDLSLAAVYAGLDPRRIRRWPTHDETERLFRHATIETEAFLVAWAPGLCLERMVALDGRPSRLADLWGAWDRVAPALLGTA